MGVVSGGGGGGASLPAQWTVDASTGALTLDLTLPADGFEHDAFVVTINNSYVFRVYLASDHSPLAELHDVNITGAIWRSETTDTYETLAILGEGEIRSRALPTADPHLSGQFWNNAGTMMISSG